MHSYQNFEDEPIYSPTSNLSQLTKPKKLSNRHKALAIDMLVQKAAFCNRVVFFLCLIATLTNMTIHEVSKHEVLSSFHSILLVSAFVLSVSIFTAKVVGYLLYTGIEDMVDYYPNSRLVSLAWVGLALVHPALIWKNSHFIFHNKSDKVDFKFLVNDLLIMFQSIYCFVEMFRTGIFLNSLERERYLVSVIQAKVRSPLFFFSKYVFLRTPLFFVFRCIGSFIILYGFLIKIAESRVDIDSPTYLGVWSNSLWIIVITMTTIGYGDMVPRTSLGRVVVLLGGLTGYTLFSFFIIALGSAYALDETEAKVNSRLLLKENRAEVEAKAGSLIAISFKFRTRSKFESEKNLANIRRRFYAVLHEFKVTKKAYALSVAKMAFNSNSQ